MKYNAVLGGALAPLSVLTIVSALFHCRRRHAWLLEREGLQGITGYQLQTSPRSRSSEELGTEISH